MSKPLRLLAVGDSEADVAPLVCELRRHGYEPEATHVDAADAMRDALQHQTWDVVIADHASPGFSSQDALRILHESGLDLPFIIVSETIGEEVAVMAMKAGAQDYVMKNHLTRLGPAVERELQEASVRQQRSEAEQSLAAHYAITRILAEAETLGEVGSKILQAIAKNGDWEAGEIWVVDRKGDVLRCLDIWHTASKPLGEFEIRTRAMTFARGVGLPGRVWASGQPAWIADVTRDANFPRAPLAAEVGLSGAIGLPIMVGHEVIGVVAFFRTVPGQPEETLLAVLNAVGGQIGQFLMRLRAEEELRKLSSAVTQTANCVLITDRNGVIEYVNPAFERTTGYAREDVVGKTPRILKSGKHDQKYYATLWNTALAGETFVADFVNRKKSGELYHTEQSITPIQDTHGHITHFVSTGHDHTERALEQEALKLFRALLDQSNDLIEVVDPETGRILDVNEKGNLALGYSREEFLALSVFDLDPTVDPSAFPAVVEQLRKTGDLMWEGIHRRKDGSTFPVEVNIRYVRLDRDYTIAVVRNITERRRAEQELRESEARFRSLTDAAQDAIVMMDPAGRITFWNKAAERAFGYSRTEAISRPMHDLIAPNQDLSEWQSGLQRFQKTGEGAAVGKTVEVQAKKNDGSLFPVELSISSVELGGEFHAVGIVRDLSLRKRAEEEQAMMEVQLRQALKLKAVGQLAAGIAHEINTPTQYVGDNTSFLQAAFSELARLHDCYDRLLAANRGGRVDPGVVSEIDSLTEEIDLGYLTSEIPKAISQSLEGLGRVTAIVNAMKEFSHPNSNEKQTVDLNHSIASTLTVSRSEWKHVADVVKDFDPELPPVPCLPGEFNQVILNLIVNAAQAIADVIAQGRGEKGIITVRTRRDGAWAVVQVSDSGGGIPEAVRERIFEPFFTTKEVGKGTGQGLAISRAVIVGKHGGMIDFESEAGIGTVFTIRLPLEAVN